MGLRGPHPKLKLVAGTTKPGGRSVFPAGTPRMPEWLSKAAGVEWKRIVPELEAAGLLSLVDRAALAAYCQAWAELAETTKIVEAEGRICKEPIQSASGEIVGEKLKAHPAMRLQRDAFNRVRQFLTEFGLSPGSRSRIGSGQTSDSTAAATPADRVQGILNRVGKAREASG